MFLFLAFLEIHILNRSLEEVNGIIQQKFFEWLHKPKEYCASRKHHLIDNALLIDRWHQ
jgi:hypothetical protein